MATTRGSKTLYSLGLLLALCASSGVAAPSRLEVSPLLAQTPGAVPSEVMRSVPAILESTRAKVLAALARGDIAGAITAYEVHVGQRAPQWLQALQMAYSAKSQEVGKCQEVARTLHTAYSRLGKTIEFIAFRAKNDQPFITLELPTGKNVTLTHNSYHVAVKLGDMVHDAFTGPLGMKLTDYFARLSARQGVDWQIITAP